MDSGSGSSSGDVALSCGKFTAPAHLLSFCFSCSFGLWYHSSSKDPPNPGCSGVWEIIDSQDVHFEQEEENKPTHGSPDKVVSPP